MNFIFKSKYSVVVSVKITVENHGFSSLRGWNGRVLSSKMLKDKLSV